MPRSHGISGNPSCHPRVAHRLWIALPVLEAYFLCRTHFQFREIFRKSAE